jgi:hypothetical protein
MKTAVLLLHVNTEEVLQGFALSDDVLLLQRSTQVINEAVITSCDSEIVDMDAEHDLPAILKTAIEEASIVE